MTEEHTDGPLEERLIHDARAKLTTIVDYVQILLDNEGYPDLLGQEKYESLAKDLTIIKTGALDTLEIVQEISELYGAQEQTTETTPTQVDKSLERRLIHDANNKLGPPVGFSQLILMDEQYLELLGPENYETLKSSLTIIGTAAQKTAELLQQLGRFYRAEEQRVELVEASTLSPEVTTYTIIHIDDEEGILLNVSDTLKESTNLIPPSRGHFGHDGKRVKYEFISYGSVEEALSALPELGDIDLLITDRQMPGLDGYDLLNRISDPSDRRYRRPEFDNVRNIAMLTGGIETIEAETVQETYGATVLTKPFERLQLEQQVYSIINPQPTQS